MNKKNLSIVVIIITTFCVCIMLYNSKARRNEENISSKAQTEDITEENNSARDNVSENKSKSSTDAQENKKTTKASVKDPSDTSISKNNKKETDVDSKSNTQNINEENGINYSNKKDIAVFKVSKEEIKDMLSLTDVLRIESIAGKLSGGDYTKVKQYLEDGDDESIINAIKLLKERLSEKDYNKFKEVAAKFINFDAIDGN